MDSLDKLLAVKNLSGRIDVLMELREWLNEKISLAEAENARLGEVVPTVMEIGGEPV